MKKGQTPSYVCPFHKYITISKIAKLLYIVDFNHPTTGLIAYRGPAPAYRPVRFRADPFLSALIALTFEKYRAGMKPAIPPTVTEKTIKAVAIAGVRSSFTRCCISGAMLIS